MPPRLYDDLTAWYRLVDPAEDHRDECADFVHAYERTACGELRTLLELGSGAGHNAVHLKQRFQCTLSDLSEPMLALSRALNPECEHLAGDMRSLRLQRRFDAVLIHDAIVYMASMPHLRAALQTAYEHTRPGGVAIFAPDSLRDTFRETTRLHQADDGARSLRFIEWTWDPDPDDETCVVDYLFAMRDASTVTTAHDRHVEGLFTRAAWTSVLTDVGYEVQFVERVLTAEDADAGYSEVYFLCRRPE